MPHTFWYQLAAIAALPTTTEAVASSANGLNTVAPVKRRPGRPKKNVAPPAMPPVPETAPAGTSSMPVGYPFMQAAIPSMAPFMPTAMPSTPALAFPGPVMAPSTPIPVLPASVMVPSTPTPMFPGIGSTPTPMFPATVTTPSTPAGAPLTPAATPLVSLQGFSGLNMNENVAQEAESDLTDIEEDDERLRMPSDDATMGNEADSV